MRHTTLLFVIFMVGCSAAPTNSQMEQLSDINKCKVEDPDIRGTYEGGCLNGFAHGKGYARGRDTYQGFSDRGKKSGYGVYRWGKSSEWAGDRYEGNWADDDREGFGSYISIANGTTLESRGVWHHDLLLHACDTETEAECVERKQNSAAKPANLVLNWEHANWTIQSSQSLGNTRLKGGHLEATFTITAGTGFSAQLASTDVYFPKKLDCEGCRTAGPGTAGES